LPTLKPYVSTANGFFHLRRRTEGELGCFSATGEKENALKGQEGGEGQEKTKEREKAIQASNGPKTKLKPVMTLSPARGGERKKRREINRTKKRGEKSFPSYQEGRGMTL